MCNTNLRGADLLRSDFRGADFRGAILDDTRIEVATVGTLPETGMEAVFPDGFLLN